MTSLANAPEHYYDRMAAHAGEHWWYRARRDLVAQLLGDRMPAGGVALDVGCGTGEVLDVLSGLGASAVVGTDLSEHVLGHAGRAGRVRVVSDASRLPFPDASADVVTSLEVVEHLDDDLAALSEYRRVLRPGGTLLVTVPAYSWLWYHQDVIAGHRRRYRRAQLLDVVADAGLHVEASSYYFSFLVPPAVLQRRTPLRRLMDDNGEESSSGRVASAVLSRLSAMERGWLSRGHTIPFGLSIWLLARR